MCLHPQFYYGFVLQVIANDWKTGRWMEDVLIWLFIFVVMLDHFLMWAINFRSFKKHVNRQSDHLSF